MEALYHAMRREELFRIHSSTIKFDNDSFDTLYDHLSYCFNWYFLYQCSPDPTHRYRCTGIDVSIYLWNVHMKTMRFDAIINCKPLLECF